MKNPTLPPQPHMRSLINNNEKKHNVISKSHNVAIKKERHKQHKNLINAEHIVKQAKVTRKKPRGKQTAQQKLKLEIFYTFNTTHLDY